jgi:hypothetical protein
VLKDAARTRRSWRKLHIGVDADTGQIIAADLTCNDADDGSQVGPLLEQIARPVASFTGDGAYDRDDVCREVCQRHPDAAVIVPPRSSAVPSATAETAPTKRGPGSEPVHLLVDSTGLKLCGPGEWLVEKDAARTRRSWRKLHIGVDADTGQIIAAEIEFYTWDEAFLFERDFC